jgi:hypothetical protein
LKIHVHWYIEMDNLRPYHISENWKSRPIPATRLHIYLYDLIMSNTWVSYDKTGTTYPSRTHMFHIDFLCWSVLLFFLVVCVVFSVSFYILSIVAWVSELHILDFPLDFILCLPFLINNTVKADNFIHDLFISFLSQFLST